jgi:3'-phosphoadenosine 5'-phosphosulfate (PAPS) 3'-phosphatase
MELVTEADPAIRQWLIQQLAAAETEVLDILRADRERLERENRNMEAALAKIRQMQNRRN